MFVVRVTPDDESQTAMIGKAKVAREAFISALVDYAFSPNETLRSYARMSGNILKQLGTLQGGRGGIVGEDNVDMTPLKTLAKKLPTKSQLRKLIEGEKDMVPYEAWLGKMDIFARLLSEETRTTS